MADEVKQDKTTVSVADNQSSGKADSKESETAAKELESKPTTEEVKPAEATTPPSTTTLPAVKTKSDKETELVALNGLMLCALAGGMFYVGTVLFTQDSLLFFTGIFIYLMVAPPGTYVHGKSKMATFTKEVAIAFGLCFALFMVLKKVMPVDADQARFFTVILTVLGVKLVFFPYYNLKSDDDQ